MNAACRVALAAVLFASCAALPAGSAAPVPDEVTLRDGSVLRCQVVALDERRLVIRKDDGSEDALDRRDVRRIELGEAPAAPPIRARVRVIEGDDVVRLLLDGEEVGSAAELRAGWVDLAPKLKEGPNELVAEVRNDGGTWAYRWVVEAGPKSETFACGLANRSGCREQGGNGLEKGTFPAGRVYLFVHRGSGEVVLQRP